MPLQNSDGTEPWILYFPRTIKRMQKKLREVNDLSFYPESHMVRAALSNGQAYGKKHSKEINRLADIADLALQPFDKAHKPLAKAMTSYNPWAR